MSPEERKVRLDYAKEVLKVALTRYERVLPAYQSGSIPEPTVEDLHLAVAKASRDVALLELGGPDETDN